MDETAVKKTPRDLLRVAFRRRKLFLLGAAALAALVLVMAHTWQLKYTGTAIFERRTDAAVQDARTSGRGGADTFHDFKLSLAHDLAGYGAVEKAAEELGLTKGMPHLPGGELTQTGQMQKQELIKGLMQSMSVSTDIGSATKDVITVSFVHHDPELAENLPNALVKNYINKTYDEIVKRLTDSRDFLQKQVTTATTRLSELVNQRIAFETQHAGMMPSSADALAGEIKQITADIETLQRQQKVATLNLSRLKALAGETTSKDKGPTTRPVQEVWGPNPELKALKDDLQKTEQRLDEALTLGHMKEAHPTVQTLRKKIASLEERIKNTKEEVVLHKVYGTAAGASDLSAQMAAAESEAEMTAAELQKLQGRLTKAQDLMANFAPVRQEYLRYIDREKDLRADLVGWQDRLTGVEMNLAAEAAKRRTHLNALETAKKQFRPSSPTFFRVIGIAIAGGLLFGAALVFAANFLDRSVPTSDAASRFFGVPIHGVIGEIVTRRERMIRRLKQWTLTPVVSAIMLLVLVGSAGSMYLRLEQPQLYARWKDTPVKVLSKLPDIVRLGPEKAFAGE